jgi:hypothetical protein
MKPPVIAGILAAALALGACSGSFGLEKEPNEWALACESVTQLIAPGATPTQRNQAITDLNKLLDTYGGDYHGGVFEILVRPVVTAAQDDDMEPAEHFHLANCTP